MERSQRQEQARLEERPFLTIDRHYPVAAEKVWRAWTDPEALKRWWGPGGPEQVSLVQLDVRVGGRFRIVFGGPHGNEHEVQGVYKAVVPPTFNTLGKLVFTWTWPNSTPDRESLVTIVFRQAVVGEKAGTELAFKHEQFFDEAARDGHKRGWGEALAKLEGYLRSEQG